MRRGALPKTCVIALIIGVTALGGRVALGSNNEGVFAAPASITITPNGYPTYDVPAYGLYDTEFFDCDAVWPGGVEDPHCDLDPANPPTWYLATPTCGYIVGSNVGEVVEWNTGHGECAGEITLEYGGGTQTAILDYTIPEEMPSDYNNYTNLPPVTQQEIDAYCNMSPAEREQWYQDRTDEAHALSDSLEAFVLDWYYNGGPAEIPEGLLPASIDNDKTKNWRLYHPDEIQGEDQWYYVRAPEIAPDFSNLHLLTVDLEATYLKLIFIAPFDSQLIVEGDFPHARFMEAQILGPFDPRHPTTANLGATEVPIIDVDIDPDPGHVNPFREGADRNAVDRHYHLTFDLKEGNAVDLNPVMQEDRYPAYRAGGNTRVGGPIIPSGIRGNGAMIASTLWMRYYMPDEGTGDLGGVGYPKAKLRLETGEEFWLGPDFTLAERRQNKLVPGSYTDPIEPNAGYAGPDVGWFKVFGFYLAYLEFYAMPRTVGWGCSSYSPPYCNTKSQWENWIADTHECEVARGPDTSPPGNHEYDASAFDYHSYMHRPFELGEDKAYVLTGRLPQTPKTKSGEPVAATGEARYWSMCHTSGGGEGEGGAGGGYYKGSVSGCLDDEDVLTDANNRYIIAYSRDTERPSNATEQCGVTWQAYGPSARQNFFWRWTSVMPGDYLREYAPTLENVPWETGAWSEPDYDRSIMGYNNQSGFMGEYQPLIHYLTTAEFEALGCPVNREDIPMWQSQPTPVGGIAESPDVGQPAIPESDSPGRRYILLLGLATVALVAVASSAIYITRRCLR